MPGGIEVSVYDSQNRVLFTSFPGTEDLGRDLLPGLLENEPIGDLERAKPLLEKGLELLTFLKEDSEKLGAEDLHELMRCWENYHRMFQAEAHVRTILCQILFDVYTNPTRKF